MTAFCTFLPSLFRSLFSPKRIPTYFMLLKLLLLLLFPPIVSMFSIQTVRIPCSMQCSMPLKRLPSFPFPQTLSRHDRHFTTALNSKPFKCAVIGGGPSGYFAAIHVSEKLEEYGISHEVDILEGTGKTLQKVRISGGGRCNLLPDTELDLRDNILKCYPRGERELYGPMMRYKPSEILDWFNSRGVETKTEADGRTFPVTDSSQTVVDCLVSSLTPSISVHLKTPITSISKNEDGTYALQTPSGTSTFSSIVFATGSSRSGYTLLQNLNHTLIPPSPPSSP